MNFNMGGDSTNGLTNSVLDPVVKFPNTRPTRLLWRRKKQWLINTATIAEFAHSACLNRYQVFRRCPAHVGSSGKSGCPG